MLAPFCEKKVLNLYNSKRNYLFPRNHHILKRVTKIYFEKHIWWNALLSVVLFLENSQSTLSYSFSIFFFPVTYQSIECRVCKKINCQYYNHYTKYLVHWGTSSFFIHMSNPPEIELYRCKKRRIVIHDIFINISTLVSLFTGVKDFNIWQDVLYRVYIFEGYKLVLFILVKYLNATSILYDTAFLSMRGKW